MPTTFRVEAVFEGISCRDYVIERDSTAFRDLAKQHLALRKMEFYDDKISAEGSGISIQRLATRPTGYIPSKFVDWLTCDQLEFVDHITYDPANLPSSADGAYQLSVQCMVPWLAKRADIHLTLRFEPTGEQRCRQVLEGTVAIKIPGVGRIAEPLIINGLRQAYADLPKLVAQWVTFRSAALADRRTHVLTQGVPLPVLALLGVAAPPLPCSKVDSEHQAPEQQPAITA